MLLPKKTKYRKYQRGDMRGVAQRGDTITFGTYALQSLGNCWMTSRQIEAARRAITHYIKRGGKVWIKVFPDKPITARPAETRMGKGKGDIVYWAAVIKKGKVIFEITGVSEEKAKEAMRLAANKLPVKTRFITRRQISI